jgi:thiamine monophosphate synthase
MSAGFYRIRGIAAVDPDRLGQDHGETRAGCYVASLQLLCDWSETTVVPCRAIGGITQQNYGTLVEADADFLTIISAIRSHPKGPCAVMRELDRPSWARLC